jgi:tight adherence protein B
MKEIILLFFFIFCFLLIVGIMFMFILLDRKMEKRINYYFEISKSIKDRKTKKEQIKMYGNSLKKMNEALKDKLSGIEQEKTDQMLKSAGVGYSSEEYIMFKWFLTAIAGGALYFLTGSLVFFIPGGIIGYMAPKMWMKKKIKLRIQKFNEGLPDMITTLVGSLRSGYSFSQALKTVAEECESPIKEEVTLMLKEMNYGITMEEALHNLSDRMPSNDFEMLIQSVLIQRQVGGNLANVLDIIVKTIRDRNKIQRQVQTLTSQGRLSGKVIGSLPVVLGGVIYLINPEYINALFSNTIGILIISAGVISGVIGFLLINKLTKIEV